MSRVRNNSGTKGPATRPGAFVEDNLQLAVSTQIDYEVQNDCLGTCGTNSGQALTYFGYALHTVTDAQSPEHEGYQMWDGMELGRCRDACCFRVFGRPFPSYDGQ